MSEKFGIVDKVPIGKVNFKRNFENEKIKAKDKEKHIKLSRNPTAPEMSQPTKISPRIFNIAADIKPSIKVQLSDLSTPRAHSVPVEPSNVLDSTDFFYFNKKSSVEVLGSRDDNIKDTVFNKYLPDNIVNQYTLTRPPLSAYAHGSTKRVTWQHENNEALGETTKDKMPKKRSIRAPKRGVVAVDESPLEASAAAQTVDSLLEYLTSASQGGDAKVSFVHVTPRCNVQYTKRYDFYDLTFVEVPGFSSGKVWTRGAQSDPSLKPHQIMQLSLEGLLCEDNLEDSLHAATGTFIPLTRFLHERKIHTKLRFLKVFGLFHEAKYFGGWRRYIKRRKFHLVSKELLKNTFFCDIELVSVVSRIVSACFRFEDETELIYFHTQGSINIIDYLALQQTHLAAILGMLNAKVDSLGNYLVEQFRVVSNAHDFDNGKIPESFLEARTGQRIVVEYREKMVRLFWLASYRLDTAICVIFHRFWQRISLLVSGITPVNTTNVKVPMGYWNLETVLTTVDRLSDDAPTHAVISSQQQKLGSYLSVDLKVCDQNRHLVDFHDAANIHTKFTIRVIPSRSELGSAIDMLSEMILQSIESIPTLKYHSFVPVARPPSMKRFYRRHVIEGAQKFANTIKKAHVDAQNVIKIGKLQDYLLKVQRLHHGLVADRLGGVVGIKKLRDIFENYESVDGIDVEFANLEVCNREMDNVQSAVAQVEEFLAQITDVKLRDGLVICYTGIAAQFHELHFLQQQRSYMQVQPIVISRCTALTDLQRYAEAVVSKLLAKLSAAEMTPVAIDPSNDSAMTHVLQLFERLRNFSFLLKGYNMERVLCEKVYSVVRETSVKAVDAIRGNRKYKFTPNDPTYQYKLCNDQHERLMSVTKTAKTVFSSYIVALRKHMIKKKEEFNVLLRQTASDTQRYFKACTSDCSTLCNDKTSSDVKLKLRSEMHEIEKLGEQLKRTKEQVNYFVKVQEFLSEAHLTVGTAIILNNNEVERFEQLNNQVEIFKMTRGLWNSTMEILSLTARIKALKVQDEVGILGCIKKYQELSAVYTEVKALFLAAGHSSIEFDAVEVEYHRCLGFLELLVSLVNPALKVNTVALQRMNTEIMTPVGYNLRVAADTVELVPVTSATQQQGSKFSEITITDLLMMKVNTKLVELKQFYCHLAAEDYISVAMEALDSTLKHLTADLKGVEWHVGESVEIVVKFCNFDEISGQLHSYQKVLGVLDLLLKQFYSSKCCAKMNEFYEYLDSAQYMMRLDSLNHKCFQLLHYMKYANPLEEDRSADTAKAYQSINDQIKLVTTIVEQKGYNVFRAADAIKKSGLKLTSLEASLCSILDEMHVTVRSLLDECPRLSLLAYHKLHLLYRAHRFGPSTFKAVIALCIHELHPFVGALHYDGAMCIGFSCIDNIEVFRFISPISLLTTLPQLMNEFEQGIKELLTASSDKNSLHRVQALRALVVKTPTPRILDNLNCIFSLRITKLLSVENVPNQVIYLLNQVWFHEDVQCCLGEVSGGLVLARPALADEKNLFRKKWKNSLKLLQKSVENNVEILQSRLNSYQSGRDGACLKQVRCKLASLLLLERSFGDLVQEIMVFSSLDDATSFWNDRYQLGFNYCKENRINNNPFEVKLGLMRVIYGLEYQGSTVRVIPTTHGDVAMQKVLGASLFKKVTVLMNHPLPFGDRSASATVTSSDIAYALGRLCLKLSFPASPATLKVFLSRLLYLDAIGNFDIPSSMHAPGLSSIYDEFNQAMNALDIKNDAYFQRHLKCYGENVSFNFSSRTQLAVDRRKNNLNNLRSHLEHYQRHKVFHNIVMVGNAFNLVDTGIPDSFNVVNVTRMLDVDSVGDLLQTAGFAHWEKITKTFLTALSDTAELPPSTQPIRSFLATARVLEAVVADARVHLSLVSFGGAGSSDAESYTVERTCFIRALLEYTHKFGRNIPDVGSDVVKTFSDCVLRLFNEQQRVDALTLEFSSTVKRKVLQSATKLGFNVENGFVRNCGVALELIMSKSPVVAVVGPSGAGKTSILNTAFNIFKDAVSGSKAADHVLESDYSFITGLLTLGKDRATHIIYRFMMRYCYKRNHAGKCTKHTVYHASLSFTSLIGSYDENSNWSDGYLLRLLKYIDYYMYEPGVYSAPDTSKASHSIIVLDGPVAFHLENIFSSLSNAYSTASHTRSLCLPSGEMYSLNPRVKLVVETSDTSQASPCFLAHFPSLSVSSSAASPQIVVSNLLKVWLKSIAKSLCTYSFWMPIFEEVKVILLESQFVSDSLFHDASQRILSAALTVSRISTFIRYLEKLFEECNRYSVEEADLVDNIPRLGKVGCMKLLARVRLSLTYAALWGFGGNLTSTERRVYDAVLRDNVANCIDHHIELPDTSLFETVLDLQKMAFVAAINSNRLLSMNSKNQDTVSAVMHLQHYDSVNHYKLDISSSATASLLQAVNMLLVSGGVPYVLGQNGCGKTHFLTHILKTLSQNSKEILRVKSDVLSTYLDAVLSCTSNRNGVKTPQIFDEFVDMNAMDERGNKSRAELTSLMQQRKVPYIATSLRVQDGANGLRAWIKGELATNTPNTYEFVNGSGGFIYVDDMHLPQPTSPAGRVEVTNNPLQFIKGIIDSNPAFNCKRSSLSNASDVAVTDAMAQVIHDDAVTDPKQIINSKRKNMDLAVSYLGVLLSGRGDNNGLFQQSIQCILKNVSLFCYPVMNAEEWEATVFAAAMQSILSTDPDKTQMIVAYKNDIYDLCRVTSAIIDRLITYFDSDKLTFIEKKLKSLMTYNINLAGKIAAGLAYGSDKLNEGGGLIQLFSKEWRSHFVDPLPDGYQKKRVCNLLREELSHLDTKRWSITTEWTLKLGEEFESVESRQWVDPDALRGNHEGGNKFKLGSVLNKLKHADSRRHCVPIRYLTSSLNGVLAATPVWEKTKGKIPKPDFNKNKETKLVDLQSYSWSSNIFQLFYPAAMSFALRLIGILTANVDNKWVLIQGYQWSSRLRIACLAAAIAGFQVSLYYPKGDRLAAGIAVPDAHLLIKLLKQCVLEAVGLKHDPLNEDRKKGNSFVLYETTPPKSQAIVVANIEEFSVEEKKILVQFLECRDPMVLFDDHEVLGLVDAVLKLQHNETASHAPAADNYDALSHNLASVNFNTIPFVRQHIMRCAALRVVVLVENNVPRAMPLRDSAVHKDFMAFYTASPSSNGNVLLDSVFAEVASYDIMQCKVLGSLMSNEFTTLWHSEDDAACVNGICQATLVDYEDECVLTLKKLDVNSIAVKSSGSHLKDDDDDDDDDDSSNYVNIDHVDGGDQGSNKRNIALLTGDLRLHIKWPRPPTNHFVGIRHVGVLSSLISQSHKDLSYSDSYMHDLLRVCTNEARLILPQIMSIHAPCDAFFAKEQVVLPSILTSNERAVMMVKQLLAETTTAICTRKQELELALKVIQESLYVVHNIPEVRSLSQQNIAILNDELVRVNDSILQSSDAFNSFQNSAAKSPEYELHRMHEEDVASAEHAFHTYIHHLNSVLSAHKQSITELESTHWNSFVHAYGAKPVPHYLTLIKAVVILTNYTPQNITKEAILRMDEKLLCRIAISMIRKPDFIETLLAVNPYALTPHHVSLLKQVNCNLWSDNTPTTFPDTVQIAFVSTLDAEGMTCPAFHALKNYLLVLELYHASHAKYVAMETSLKAKSLEFERGSLEYNQAIESRTEQFRGFKNELTDQLQSLEATLLKNKSQVDAINVLEGIREECLVHLQFFRDYMKNELNKLKEITRFAAADACVIAAVATRAGFLPEQVRQECMDTFRQALRKLGHHDVSDSPFVLGCYADMNQFRRWTNPSTIPRDPTTINGLCLSLLASNYSYIYDPDMLAMEVLRENMPRGFHWYHVLARDFSLNSLVEFSHALAATLAYRPAIFIVISELEVGISDELVTFLSGDTVHTSISREMPGSGSRPADEAADVLTIKVTLVSQILPSLRAGAELTQPLPASCLRNVSVTHWGSSSPSPFFDSKPFLAQQNKNYVEDHALQAHFVSALTTALAPLHRKKYNKIEASISAVQGDLQRCYERVLSQIFAWNSSDGLSTGSVSHINNIFLGISGSSRARRSMESLYKEIQALDAKLHALYRDQDSLALYEVALHNTVESSANFIRMCKLVIPAKLVIPFAFSTDVLAAKYIKIVQNTLNSLRIHLPTSIHQLHRINKGVALFQQLYRRSRQQSPRDSSTDEGLTVEKINAIMDPVSKVCLRSVIEYTTSCVCPGHEYLVRFCALLFFSTNKQHSLYPAEELRLYSQLLLPRMCDVPVLAASYYAGIPADNSKSLARLASSLVEIREEKRKFQVYAKQEDSSNCVAGLLVNLHSPRWTHPAVPRTSSSSAFCSSSSYQMVNSDILAGARLTLRNSKFHPLARVGDIFNLELLHCCRVHVFAADNVNSIVGLGADEHILELMTTSSSGLMKKLLKEALKLKQFGKSQENVGRKQREDAVSDLTSMRDKLAMKQQKASSKLRSNFFVNQVEHVVIDEDDDVRRIVQRISMLRKRRQSTTAAAPPTNLLQAALLEVESKESLEFHQGAYHNRLHKMLYNTHGVNRFNVHSIIIELKRELRVDRSSKTLLDFMPSPTQWTLLDLLERHSAFSTVFRALKLAISESLNDFLLWKDILEYLIRHNISSTSLAELDEIVCLLIPPLFDHTKVEVKRSEGLWAQGYELSVLQTVLFADIIVPGASKYIIQQYLSLVAIYLNNNGKLSPNSSGAEADEDDEDEEDDEDGVEKEKSGVGALEGNIKWQKGLSCVNNWSYLRQHIAANEKTITRKLPPFDASGKSAELFLSFILSAEYSLETVYSSYNRYLSLHGLRHKDDQNCVFYTEQPFGGKFIHYQLGRSHYDRHHLTVPLRSFNINQLVTSGDELSALKKELQQGTTRMLIHTINAENNVVSNLIIDSILETPAHARGTPADAKQPVSLVVSSAHGSRGSCSTRLPQSLSKLRSYWLPPVTCNMAVCHVNCLQQSVFMAPSVAESTALLADELENSLLDVLIQQKEISQSNLALRDRHELLRTSKIVIRIVASILTVRRLCYYHYASLAGSGEGIEWFYSYEQVTMSQYMSILAKIKSLLATDFGGILSPAELKSLPLIVANHLFHTLTNYDEILLPSLRAHRASQFHDMINKEFTLLSRVYMAAIVSKTHNLWRVGLGLGGAAFVIQPTQFGKVLDNNSFMLGTLTSNQIIQGLLVWTYDGLDHVKNEKRRSYKTYLKLQHATKRFLLTKKFNA